MFTWLESTSLAQWVQVSLYGWAIMLTLHAIGTATVVGVNLVAGLRVVGLFRPIPYRSITKLITLAWFAVALNIISGFSLFASQASMYVVNAMFLIKITLIVLGIGATYHLQKAVDRDGPNWDAAGATSARGFQLAVAILVIWTAVVLVARLIAYL